MQNNLVPQENLTKRSVLYQCTGHSSFLFEKHTLRPKFLLRSNHSENKRKFLLEI